jgi:hypothetical protein
VRIAAIRREARAVLHVWRAETRTGRSGRVECALLQVARPDAAALARHRAGSPPLGLAGLLSDI